MEYRTASVRPGPFWKRGPLPKYLKFAGVFGLKPKNSAARFVSTALSLMHARTIKMAELSSLADFSSP